MSQGRNHGFATKAMDEIGKLVGGWLKSSASNAGNATATCGNRS
jgi:hypothetical protein